MKRTKPTQRKVKKTRKELGVWVERDKRRGRSKKKWMDCVKEDTARKLVNSNMTSDRVEWKDKTYCKSPNDKTNLTFKRTDSIKTNLVLYSSNKHAL